MPRISAIILYDGDKSKWYQTNELFFFKIYVRKRESEWFVEIWEYGEMHLPHGHPIEF